MRDCRYCINIDMCQQVDSESEMTIEEAIEILDCYDINYNYSEEYSYRFNKALNIVINTLEHKLETAYWIDEGEREPWFRCSACSERAFGSHYKFCPHCGLQIKGVKY